MRNYLLDGRHPILNNAANIVQVYMVGKNFFLALVALGERIYTLSRIEATEETEREICSWRARSSVKCWKLASKYLVR